MLNIKKSLDTLISRALDKATGEQNCQAIINLSTRPEFGDYQANGVMAIAKKLKRNPRELAAQVVAAIEDNPLLSDVQVAGPGFINLFLRDDWLQQLGNELNLAKRPFVSPVAQPQTIVVDYSGPNLAKEMHVGHLRGTIIGDSLVRVLEALGHNVIRQNHVGDWGTQFGMLIAHMEDVAKNNEAPAALSDLEAFYREAKQRFDNEPAFSDRARSYVVKLQQGDAHCLASWNTFITESLKHCEQIYDLLGVSLSEDDLKPESFYNDDLAPLVKELDDKGLLSESEGAKCVFMEEFKGKEGAPLPAIVQKSDGGFLYATTDLAAVRYRSKSLAAQRVLYVVDARQSLHFQQIFAISHKAGFVDDSVSLEHIAYGTMMGQDGKPFKTRSGDTVKLQELLEESIRRAYDIVSEKNPQLSDEERQNISRVVGISAVKYADLSKNRTSDYIFDWSTMLSFEGNTAPYMLYAYARIKSILRKNEDAFDKSSGSLSVKEEAERALLLKILQFPEVINNVATECYPNLLCNYLFELAGVFMRFYEQCPVLKAEADVRQSRLLLAELSANTLQKGLELLGLETLEKM
ncbi:MAG: arginine--tRNA ligase [Pseudohongiellaceae bacterium]|nr:arginine--tRNA ligase [Pseudohongiellaceae bacterium]